MKEHQVLQAHCLALVLLHFCPKGSSVIYLNDLASHGGEDVKDSQSGYLLTLTRVTIPATGQLVDFDQLIILPFSSRWL